MLTKNHPYHFLTKFILNNPNAIFHLSKYVYEADSLLDIREPLSVKADEFTEAWVLSTIESLLPNQELAFHSKVTINGKVRHIPMIDFAVNHPDWQEEIINRLRLYLPKKTILTMAIFDSGRSFHSYSATLLTHKEWINFMGRLLLIDPKIGKSFIDSRWIGHRLIGGFASLRWSNNSAYYLKEPNQIKILI